MHTVAQRSALIDHDRPLVALTTVNTKKRTFIQLPYSQCQQKIGHRAVTEDISTVVRTDVIASQTNVKIKSEPPTTAVNVALTQKSFHYLV